ncbi:MAG: site-2 protease family protein [Nanoarchaeota archaeon]|nr:site-2 protease family protein [Nanoarchaeota archaeon]
MNFVVLDLVLLGVFLLFVGMFLYRNRKNVKKDGWLLLYRTKWGMRLIENTAKKHPKTLKVMSYIIVVLGYILTVLMLWMFIRIIWIYLFNADIVRAIKIPPITPLIPYLPQVFKLNFLPPFYFIYWIIIIAAIAIPHEFFHGIYMRLYGIKIKSTGFGFFPFFLPIFLAAFVEQDEKSMVKASNHNQRVVLAAGTFANTLTAIIGLILVAIFFSFSFTASGIVFDGYAYEIVNTSQLTMVNGIALDNPSYAQIADLVDDTENANFSIGEQQYLGLRGSSSDGSLVALYNSAPAIKSDLYGPIISVNGNSISSIEDFSNELSKYSIGEEITLTTEVNGERIDYQITLEENPENPGTAWIGITFLQQSQGLMTKILTSANFYKKPHIYYAEDYEGAQFIYDLLWWLVLISFSVALINMLPMGIFDGGRFFYLTVLKLTKSEKAARNSFKWLTWFLLFLVLLIMVYWVIAII